MELSLVLEGTVPLGVAVGLGYVVAVMLGVSFGKIPKLGPMIRFAWYSCFWTSVVVQSVAIVTAALSFWVRVPGEFSLALLGAVALLLATSFTLMCVTYWIDSHRKNTDDGLNLDGAAAAAGGVVDAMISPFPYLLLIDGEGCIAGLAILLVGFLLFGAAFFPQRLIVRTVSRIVKVGLLKA